MSGLASHWAGWFAFSGEAEPVPSIVVSQETDQAQVEHALRDHVMADLAEPIQANEMRPAIFLVMNRFKQFQELREENAELKDASRTLIQADELLRES